MKEKDTGDVCKKCGVSLVVSCPVSEEEFCEKKKAIICPNCQYAQLEDETFAKCNYPDN